MCSCGDVLAISNVSRIKGVTAGLRKQWQFERFRKHSMRWKWYQTIMHPVDANYIPSSSFSSIYSLLQSQPSNYVSWKNNISCHVLPAQWDSSLVSWSFCLPKCNHNAPRICLTAAISNIYVQQPWCVAFSVHVCLRELMRERNRLGHKGIVREIKNKQFTKMLLFSIPG